MLYYIVGGILLLIFFLKIKYVIWDLPHKKIQSLANHIQTLQQEHQREISTLKNRLEDSSNILIQKQEFDDIIDRCSWGGRR